MSFTFKSCTACILSGSIQFGISLEVSCLASPTIRPVNVSHSCNKKCELISSLCYVYGRILIAQRDWFETHSSQWKQAFHLDMTRHTAQIIAPTNDTKSSSSNRIVRPTTHQLRQKCYLCMVQSQSPAAATSNTEGGKDRLTNRLWTATVNTNTVPTYVFFKQIREHAMHHVKGEHEPISFE